MAKPVALVLDQWPFPFDILFQNLLHQNMLYHSATSICGTNIPVHCASIFCFFNKQSSTLLCSIQHGISIIISIYTLFLFLINHVRTFNFNLFINRTNNRVVRSNYSCCIIAIRSYPCSLHSWNCFFFFFGVPYSFKLNNEAMGIDDEKHMIKQKQI